MQIEKELLSKGRKLTFLGPYERYKLVKPYIQAEEFKEEAEKQVKIDDTDDDPSIEDRIASVNNIPVSLYLLDYFKYVLKKKLYYINFSRQNVILVDYMSFYGQI